jgi:hypothetical protein
MFLITTTTNDRGRDMKKFMLLTTLALVLAGCAASGPRVITQSNPATDISSFATYNFMQPLGTDRAGGIQTPLSAMVASAMALELESRGFRLSDNPDLLVNVFVSTEERTDVRQVSTGSSFHSYRGRRYGTWGSYHSTVVRQYIRGTLAIDLVDAQQMILAWEGIAQQRLGRNAERITQEQVNSATKAVMAEFAYMAK